MVGLENQFLAFLLSGDITLVGMEIVTIHLKGMMSAILRTPDIVMSWDGDVRSHLGRRLFDKSLNKQKMS